MSLGYPGPISHNKIEYDENLSCNLREDFKVWLIDHYIPLTILSLPIFPHLILTYKQFFNIWSFSEYFIFYLFTAWKVSK